MSISLRGEILNAIGAAVQLGPAFVRAIGRPLPEAQVVATGDVAATDASVSEWILAGAAARGLGSGPVAAAFTSGADPAPLSHTAADLNRWVALARFEQGTSMRQPAGLQVALSQESQP